MAVQASFPFQKSLTALPGTIAFLALTAMAQAAPARQGDSLQSQLIARCDRALELDHLEGLVVVVQVEDTVVLGRGWGRLAGSELAAPTSPFRAEALVEPLVCWTAMHLIQGASLREGATLHDLLPGDFPEDPWAKRTVRVQHLLNHTSGLIGWGTALPADGKTDAKSLMGRVAELGIESEPGSCYGYSESNSLVLGAVVEKVAKMSLSTAVESRVLARLELEDTGWRREGLPPEASDNGASREFAGQLVDAPQGIHPFAEDKFCSTAADATTLLRALGQGKVVGAAALGEMLIERKLSGGDPVGVGYGLNFASLGEVSGFSIGGCAEGTTVHVAHYPEVDVTVTCLAATTGAALIPLERDLTRLALGLALPGTDPVLLPAADAGKVVGRYQVGCTTLEVALQKDGTVVLASGGAKERALDYRGALQFVARNDGDVRFEFVLPKGEARATLIRISDHGRYSEAVRVL